MEESYLNEYTLASGYVLHLDDGQLEQAKYFLDQFQEMLEEFGDIDLAQYVASELVNQLREPNYKYDQIHHKQFLRDTPAEVAEKSAIEEAED